MGLCVTHFCDGVRSCVGMSCVACLESGACGVNGDAASRWCLFARENLYERSKAIIHSGSAVDFGFGGKRDGCGVVVAAGDGEAAAAVGGAACRV